MCFDKLILIRLLIIHTVILTAIEKSFCKI